MPCLIQIESHCVRQLFVIVEWQVADHEGCKMQPSCLLNRMVLDRFVFVQSVTCFGVLNCLLAVMKRRMIG